MDQIIPVLVGEKNGIKYVSRPHNKELIVNAINKHKDLIDGYIKNNRIAIIDSIKQEIYSNYKEDRIGMMKFHKEIVDGLEENVESRIRFLKSIEEEHAKINILYEAQRDLLLISKRLSEQPKTTPSGTIIVKTYPVGNSYLHIEYMEKYDENSTLFKRAFGSFNLRAAKITLTKDVNNHGKE